jgi:hypothetical protein
MQGVLAWRRTGRTSKGVKRLLSCCLGAANQSIMAAPGLLDVFVIDYRRHELQLRTHSGRQPS